MLDLCDKEAAAKLLHSVLCGPSGGYNPAERVVARRYAVRAFSLFLLAAGLAVAIDEPVFAQGRGASARHGG